MIKKIALSLIVVASFLLPQFCTAARAQSIQTFASAAGNDSNTASDCVLTHPCQTIDAALSVTAVGGTVVCLDTGLIAGTPINITQSVIIDCHDRLVAAVPTSGVTCGGDGIHINAPGGIVTLRNINISGIPSISNCIQNGISIAAASVVNIEDCVAENVMQSGISVTTSANTVLNVINTRIRNAANGVSFAPTGGSVNGSIDHTIITKISGDGIMATGAAYFTVTNSVISNAASVGVDAGAGAVLEVDSSSVSNNRTAFATSGGTIRISHNLIYDNVINYSIAGGFIATSGDNKVAVNGSTVPNGSITQQ